MSYESRGFKEFLTDTSPPLLTKSEEVALGHLSRAGDIQARNKLVECNLRLAISVVKRFKKCAVPVEDLMQVAHISLIKAASMYDPSRGFRFSTYAMQVMYFEIVGYLKDMRWPIRIPPNTLKTKRLYDALPDHFKTTKSENVKIEAVDHFNDIDHYIEVEDKLLKRKQMRTAICRLKPQYKSIIRDKIKGTDTLIIAAKHGVTRSYVNFVTRMAIQELQSMLGVTSEV